MIAQQLGLLVAIEGPGGSGKTTACAAAAKILGDEGVSVATVRQPSSSPIGELARHGHKDIRGAALACLVAADRYHQQDTELRSLRRHHQVVLCDRYMASTIALQTSDGVPTDFLMALNEGIDRADLTLVLDAPAVTLAARVASRGSHGRFESGIASSEAEIAGFDLAHERLAAKGWLLERVDTVGLTADAVARIVATRVWALPERTGL